MQVEELDVDLVEEWMGGSRIGGRAAGAMREKGIYLGMLATRADAEAAGVALAWERWPLIAKR